MSAARRNGARNRTAAGAVVTFAADVTAEAARQRLKAVFAGSPGPVAVGLWRPSPTLCEAADELAFGHRRTWLPIIMDHPHLRVGPLVVPGQGACFSCFAARQAQHDAERTASAAVLKAYDLDGQLGPRGYLSHHARLAAALAHVMLGRLGEVPASVAGQVVSVNVLRSGFRAHRVASRPGCARCGCSRRRGDSDVLAGLVAAITAGRKGDDPVRSAGLKGRVPNGR
jgi:bacteriocin biosynthesis cyclodehydratase domain-containing protein